LKGSQLSPADKGLVTEIVYGTVARKLTLEWYLSHFIEDRDKLDNWLYILLLLSAYQLRYLDKIPNLIPLGSTFCPTDLPPYFSELIFSFINFYCDMSCRFSNNISSSHCSWADSF
ncbi:MAG: transcription antitermination factor NusB, partial [Leptotrichia hongkongensis]